MKVIITVDFQNEPSKADFLNVVTQALGEICGGSSINATDMGTLSVIHCCQPEDNVSSAPPVEVPAVELSSDTFDADLNAQAAVAATNSAIGGEPETVVLPAVEIPATEIPAVDCPPVELDKGVEANEVVPTFPNCVIMSLTSANNVQAEISKDDLSYLLVPSDVASSDGLLDFWFGGIEFRIPATVDNQAVANPNHPISGSTIRIVARALDGDATFALLVDVIRGDMELLSLSKEDAELIKHIAG